MMAVLISCTKFVKLLTENELYGKKIMVDMESCNAWIFMFFREKSYLNIYIRNTIASWNFF